MHEILVISNNSLNLKLFFKYMVTPYMCWCNCKPKFDLLSKSTLFKPNNDLAIVKIVRFII